MSPLEALVSRMTMSTLIRLDQAARHRADRDLRTIHAMAEVSRRGLAQRFRYAAARVRAIQQGAKK